MHPIEYYAKARKIMIWIVPNSEPVMNGKVTWSYEIEILPYTPIGEYFRTHTEHYMKYSYQEWDSYDEAEVAAYKRARELYSEYMDTKI